MVNIGKAAGFFPGNLMELVNRNVNGPKPEIGRIDLMPGYTLFDVRKEDAKRVLNSLRHATFFGDRIHAEFAEDGRDYGSESRPRPRKKRKEREGDEQKPRPLIHKGKEKKAKAAKSDKKKGKKKDKPKYDGNYEMFYKK